MTSPTTNQTTTMPCNMHTDLTIAGKPDGSIVLGGKSSTGTASLVQLSAGIATRVGQAVGLPGPPAPNVVSPHNMHTDASSAGSGAVPLNMHTDGSTTIDPTPSGTSLTVSGPADLPTGGSVPLDLTIDGPALNTLKGAHAGL